MSSQSFSKEKGNQAKPKNVEETLQRVKYTYAMNKKDKVFLGFVAMGACALSLLTLVSENSRFLAGETTEYVQNCCDLVFGGAFISSSGTEVGTSQCYTSTLPSFSFSSSYSYKSDPTDNTITGRALKFGNTSYQASLTLSFASPLIISKVKIYANSYSSSQGNTTLTAVTKSLSDTTIATVSNTVTYNSAYTRVDVGNLVVDTTATAALAYTFSDLDGGPGTRAAASSLTLTPANKKAPYIAKIVFTVLTERAPSSSSSASSSSSSSSSLSSSSSVAPTLSSISVDTLPTKTSYKQGETLDTSGLVVTAHYSDSSSIDVTSVCVLDPSNGSTLSTIGTTTINVSYTDGAITKNTSFDVPVEASGTGYSLMIRFKEILSGMYCDSIYLKYGSWDCLIDGGNSSDKATVASALTTYCTDHKLDLYVATHSHNDHAGIFTSATETNNVFIDGGVTSFGYIVDCGSYRSVTSFWQPYCDEVRDKYMVADHGGTYIPVHAMFNSDSGFTSFNGLSVLNISGDVGDPATLGSNGSGDVSLRFLNTGCYLTPHTTSDSEPNRTSVACLLSAWNQRYLFCGDAEGETENGIIANYSDTYGNPTLWSASDDVYLKADHHCSDTLGSNSQTWIDWVHPDHVMISAAITSANSASNTGLSQDHPNVDSLIRFESATWDIHWNGVNGTFSYTSVDGSTPTFAGTAKTIPYYVGSTMITGEENTTLPLSQWCQSSTSYCYSAHKVTGGLSAKRPSAWSTPLGSFINADFDYEVMAELASEKPSVNEKGELYDETNDTYC